MPSVSEKWDKTPKVDNDELIIFTKDEIRKMIRYFRQKLSSARLQQSSLVNRLKRVINILEWHESVEALHFSRQFIRYLLYFKGQCKGLSRSVDSITRRLQRLNMTKRGNTSFVRQD